VPTVLDVRFDASSVTFVLGDGRSVSAPLDWYPRLLGATPSERETWALIGAGHGVHWPEIDEDISVENLLLGQRSMEGKASFQAWREAHARQHGFVGPGVQ